MSADGEEFLREWFHGLPVADEPESLRVFLERLPGQGKLTPRPARGHRRPGRAAGAAAAVVAMAAVLTAAIAAGSLLGGPGPATPSPVSTPAGPSETATVKASATPIRTASASPTPGFSVAWPIDGLPVVGVPPAAIRRLDIGDALGASTSPSVAWGPRTYVVAPAATNTRLTVATEDLAAGAVASGDVTWPAAARPESVCSVVADASWLVVEAGRTAGGASCGSGGEAVDWRILAVALDPTGHPSGAFTLVAAGRNRHIQNPQGEGLPTLQLPSIALDAGRVAYDVEDTTAGRPNGCRVLVRSLPGGGIERDVKSQTQVYNLSLSGTTVAWAEADDVTAPHPAVAVRVSTAVHPSPTDVWRATSLPTDGWGYPTVLVEGGVIAWSGADIREVYVAEPGQATRLVSPSGLSVGSSCNLQALWNGRVAMVCSLAGPESPDGVSLRREAMLTWTPASGLSVVTGDPAVDPSDVGLWANAGPGGWVHGLELNSTTRTLGFPLDALPG